MLYLLITINLLNFIKYIVKVNIQLKIIFVKYEILVKYNSKLKKLNRNYNS